MKDQMEHQMELKLEAISECARLRARVAALEALHRAYYNQPFAEACQRAARDERERCITKALGWWSETENPEELTTDEAAEGIRAALCA